ncbi:ROK family transcriptional regulator [Microbacterium sp.]|uniref:ROK family transcriptional regulator n=1 Tax=Microbacterium sp. TaxID=51671 RepID=UPI0028124464|nr:ROK family transcriptional regulator [Microbacterium sp.]
MFDAIRRLGRTSRVEIAGETGFTAATVTHAVRALLAEGLIVETGDVARTRGKPRVMLSLAPKARCAVGVQLEADWTVIAVVDATGRLVARQRIRGARSADPGAVVERVCGHVLALLRASDVAVEAALGLGLVLPGRLDIDRGTLVESSSLPQWVGIGIRDMFEGATGLPVLIGNDATAAAQGELWGGGLVRSRAHATVCMGASIGLGLVLSGQVYAGATANAGALGSMPLPGSADGATLAEIAAPPAVSAAARTEAGTHLPLSADDDPFADFAAISAAAVQGDALASALIQTSADHLADAIVVLSALLDLDSVTLTGPSFAVAGSIYLAALRRRFAQQPRASAAPVRTRLSMQAADAAAVGAAAMVLGIAMPALAEDAPWHRS